jgi:hypothetical protein
MVQPGEDADFCFEDDCDCENDEEKQEGEEENSEADLLKHDEYCTYRRGYWGDILSERDIGVCTFIAQDSVTEYSTNGKYV